VDVPASELLSLDRTPGQVTEAGVRQNVSVALQYLDAWLGGWGAAAINNLMEDAATAEISRSQLWQWRFNAVELEDGRTMSAGLYEQIRTEELDRLRDEDRDNGHLAEAAELLDDLVLNDDFVGFLTLPGYDKLD
jgi:malate synthase